MFPKKLLLLICLGMLPETASRKYKIRKESGQELEWKFQKLTELRSASNLIEEVTGDSFVRLLVNQPRNYSAFVLFSTRDSRCLECFEAEHSVQLLAISYTATSKPFYTLQQPCFFLEVLQENHPQILRMVGVGSTNLPVLFYFPQHGMLEDLQELDLSNDKETPESIAAWVQDVSGISISIQKHGFVQNDEGAEPFLMKYLAIALTISHVYKQRILLTNLVLHQTSTVIAVVTIVIVCYFTSGHTYNWIHSIPMIGQLPSGIHFIHPQSNSQIGAESFLILLLYVTSTFSMLALIEVRKQGEWQWKGTVGWVGFVAFLTSFNILHKIYSQKLGN